MDDSAKKNPFSLSEVEGNLENAYFVFFDGKEGYCLGSRDVVEVVSRAVPTRVPFTPPWLQGVISARGEIVPVVDLNRYFGLDGGSEMERQRLIVVEQEQQLVAIWATAITGVEALSPEALDAPMSTLPDQLAQCMLGQWRKGERIIYCLDTKKLFRQTAHELKAG